LVLTFSTAISARSDNQVPWFYHSVVFDLDGVLIDSEPVFEEAAKRLLERRGLVWAPEVAHAMMGTPAKEAFAFFREHYQLLESIEELAAESSVDFYAAIGEGRIPLMAGVVDLLDQLQQNGTPIAIATSSSRSYVDRVLAAHGLLGRFGFVLTCEDVDLGKPHPEVYEKAAKRMGHSPEFMIVLEDSVNGVSAAKAAGAKCIAVPHERVQRAGLATADLIVSSLEDMELRRFLGID
jgi:HAD superfamily hydrolase (TIGR01509 family)